MSVEVGGLLKLHEARWSSTCSHVACYPDCQEREKDLAPLGQRGPAPPPSARNRENRIPGKLRPDRLIQRPNPLL